MTDTWVEERRDILRDALGCENDEGYGCECCPWRPAAYAALAELARLASIALPALSEYRYLVHLYRGNNNDLHFDRLADKAAVDHAAALQLVGWPTSATAADAAS